MKERAIQFLACPTCQSRLSLHEPRFDGQEIVSGELICGGACGKRYQIVGGIPRFAAHLGLQEETAEHFGFQWAKFLEGKFETDAVYGVTQAEWIEYFQKSLGMNLADIKGKRILDAGCGSGKLAAALAPYGCEIVSFDIHEGLDHVYARTRGHENVHTIQGDVLNPPFAAGQFDIVWSSGVIHHTPDPKLAFEMLRRLVAKDGLLYIWIYRKRRNPYRMIRDTLRVGYRLPPWMLFPLSYAMALPLFGLFNVWHLLGRGGGEQSAFGFKQAKNRKRSVREIALNLFDNITPRYHYRFEEAEVLGWFREGGFEDLSSSDPVDIGISGRMPVCPASRRSTEPKQAPLTVQHPPFSS